MSQSSTRYTLLETWEWSAVRFPASLPSLRSLRVLCYIASFCAFSSSSIAFKLRSASLVDTHVRILNVEVYSEMILYLSYLALIWFVTACVIFIYLVTR